MGERLTRVMVSLVSMVMILITFSGCVKLNTNYRFVDGRVSGSIFYQLSPEILETYDGIYHSYSDYPQSDLETLCVEIVGVEFADFFNAAKINGDGWLECSLSAGERTVHEFGSDGVFFNVMYNDSDANYTVTVDTSDLNEKLNNGLKTLRLTPDVELKMGFEFKNLKTVTVDGFKVDNNNPHGGITQNGNKVTLDLLFFRENQEIQIVGSDVAGAKTMWIILSGIFLVSAGSAIGVSVWRLRRNKNRTEKHSSNPNFLPHTSEFESSGHDLNLDNEINSDSVVGDDSFSPNGSHYADIMFGNGSSGSTVRHDGFKPWVNPADTFFDPSDVSEGGLGGITENDTKE